MKNKLTIATLAGLVTVGSVMPVSAQYAMEWTLRSVRSNTANTVSAVNNTTSAVRTNTSEIRDLRNDVRTQSRILMDALRMQTGEQSAYADKQIEAYKRIEDASQQNATDRMRQEVRANAESGEFDPNPDACLILDLFGTSGAGDPMPPSAGAQGTRSVEATRVERSRIGNLGAAGAAREMADKEVIINGKDASEDASTFLKDPTFDMTKPRNAQAAEAFLLKMLDPLPPQGVSDTLISTPEGAAKAAVLATRKNRESIVEENWAMLGNMTSAVVDGDELRKFSKGTPYNRPIGKTASELQVLDVMTVRHYSPPAEAAGEAVQTGVVLQKIHQLMAIQARMQYMQLEMQRRDLLTQSAILAKMVEDDGK